ALERKAELLGLRSAATLERHLCKQAMDADAQVTRIDPHCELGPAEVRVREGLDLLAVEVEDHLGDLLARDSCAERTALAPRRAEQACTAGRDPLAEHDLAGLLGVG